MSSQRPPLTEARLDRMLDRWLGEGPSTVADRVPEAALLIVATRRQKRRGFLSQFALDATGGRLVAAGAAIVVVVAVGIGLWRGSQVIVQPSPSPSVSPSAQPTPTPSPEPTPVALESFAYPELGWQIDLPSNWVAADSGALPEPYRAFSGLGEPAGRLEIALGSEQGEIEACRFASCTAVTARSLDQYAEAIFGPPDSGSPFQSGPEETAIGGEPAQLYRLVNLDIPGVSEVFVVAMHGARPLFLHVHPIAGEANSELSEILGAFRFLDPITFTPFRSDDGYSVSVPAGWRERPGIDCPGLQILSGVVEPYGSMLISYGQPDGSFYLDDAVDACWAGSATALLGLREDVLSTGGFPFAGQFGSNHDTDLGGEVAWLFAGREFLAADRTFWVIAFHDGRPVVLRLRFSSIDPYPSPITEIVASFQFKD